MRYPTLNELPSPPLGKIGWPWMEEDLQVPAAIPDGSLWPRVSIVTPSYNQAPFIEETIRSVLLQGYPNLEYIIIDGGSTDGSVDIIRKYEPWLAYWVSEPDAGQSEALNKGFDRATGDIVAWINSDDVYLPGVFAKRMAEFGSAPDAVLIYGDCNFINENGSLIRTWQAEPCSTPTLLLKGNQIPQQSVFMRSGAFAGVGGINPTLHYIMDYELWVRMSLVGELRYFPSPVANFRHHAVSKSVADGYKFVLEIIDWLSTWEQFDDSLSEPERAEVFRRLHVKAALEFIFAGQEEQAIRHFQSAFQDNVYPYGDVDALAERIADFSGMGSHSMHDSWEWVAGLRPVLQQALPNNSGLRLWRRVASRYHMHKVFNGEESRQVGAIRSHLFHGLGYDLRWSGNLGVLSLGMHAFLGRWVTNAFKAGYRQMRHRVVSASPESGISRAEE